MLNHSAFKLSLDLAAFWASLIDVAAEHGHGHLGSGMKTINIFFNCARATDTAFGWPVETMLPEMFNHAVGALGDVDHAGANRLLRCLEPFLDNNLSINKYIRAGEDGYEEYFFCFKVKDEDIPWDLTQHDW